MQARLSTGIDLFYEVHGDGPPLLLLMGTSADHRFWGGQVPAYSEHFTTIVYDSRGVGRSTVPEDPTTCSMALMADDAVALLDALELEAAHVSGLSLGSTVAQEMCLRHPERVLSAQMHGTWARSDEWFVRMIESLEDPLHRDDMPAFVRRAMMWIASPTMLASGGVQDLEAAFLAEAPAARGVLGHTHADKHHDALDRLGSIACPVLVTAGEADTQVPERYGREVAAEIPRAEFHRFEGPCSSHLTSLEMGDEFNRVTLDWLRRTAGV